MKSNLFARPNLKVLLLGATLLLCVQHVITTGRSELTKGQAPASANARGNTHGELRQLLEEVTWRPSSQAYLRLSDYYEKRGEYKKALQSFRKAEEVAQTEDGGE